MRKIALALLVMALTLGSLAAVATAGPSDYTLLSTQRVGH